MPKNDEELETRVAPLVGHDGQGLPQSGNGVMPVAAERTETPIRIWCLPCPFRKNGTPVLGSFGKSEQSVVMMTHASWKRLVDMVPQLQTTFFEVGHYDE